MLRYLLIIFISDAIYNLEINELKITNQNFLNLQNKQNKERDNLSSQLLTPDVKKILESLSQNIYIDKNDTSIHTSLPDMHLRKKCDADVKSKFIKGSMSISNQSYIKGVIDYSWNSLSMIGEMDVQAQIDGSAKIAVRTGFKFMGKCKFVATKVAGVALYNQGRVKIGVELKANDSFLEEINGRWYLVFNLNFNFYGVVINFDLERIALKGCKISLLGIKIYDFCKFLEKRTKVLIQSIYNVVTDVSIPNLLVRIETAIQSKVNKQIKIPLSIY